jgi:hypothetical protein
MKNGWQRHKKAPGRRPAERGQAWPTAGDKNRPTGRPTANKDQDGRRRAALEEARLERERLEARLALEAETTRRGEGGRRGVGDRPRTLRVVEECEPAPAPVTAPAAPSASGQELAGGPGRGGEKYTMGEARQMLRKGYHLLHVMERTGWGFNAFDDMYVDQDGYGMPLEFELGRLHALPSATPWA